MYQHDLMIRNFGFDERNFSIDVVYLKMDDRFGLRGGLGERVYRNLDGEIESFLLLVIIKDD